MCKKILSIIYQNTKGIDFFIKNVKKVFIVIKNSTLFLLSIGCIFCVEIKSMDCWDSFKSLNFRDLVLSILDGVRSVETDILMLQKDPINPAIIIDQKEDLPDEFIMHNNDDTSIIYPVFDEDALEEEIDTLIMHNNDGTSTMRFAFDEHSLEEIDIRGSGHLYLYQDKNSPNGWIEITTPTEDIHRFKINYGYNNATVIVSPKKSADVTRYSCCVYVKQRIPELSLKNHVIARLATNITSDYLSFKLQEWARLLATDKRIKVQLLRVSAWGDAQITKMQGVATRQELFLCDNTQYTSALKSDRVHIDAHEKSKAHIYFENNVRTPGVIKGRLDNISELRYSGNPVVRDMRCNHSSLLKCIEK